jgi:hypothetical protein
MKAVSGTASWRCFPPIARRQHQPARAPIAAADALYEQLQLDRLALVRSEHQLRKRPERRFDVVFRQLQVDSGCDRISDWGAIRIRIEDLLDKHQRDVAAVANFVAVLVGGIRGLVAGTPSSPRQGAGWAPHHGAVSQAKGVCLFGFRELVIPRVARVSPDRCI